jgi:hypothetical protein
LFRGGRYSELKVSLIKKFIKKHRDTLKRWVFENFPTVVTLIYAEKNQQIEQKWSLKKVFLIHFDQILVDRR